MSAGSTVAALYQRIRSELSENDTDFFTDEDLLDFLNEGQEAIVTACPLAASDSFQSQTVSGSGRYLLPPECVQPTATWLADSTGEFYRLDFLEPDLADHRPRWTTRGSTRGQVTYRPVRDGIAIEIQPVPATTGLDLIVVSHINPRTLTAESDQTDIEARFTYLLVLYALSKCKRKDEETTQADRYATDFQNEMQKLQAKEMIHQADQFNRTRLYRGIQRRGGWR